MKLKGHSANIIIPLALMLSLVISAFCWAFKCSFVLSCTILAFLVPGILFVLSWPFHVYEIAEDGIHLTQFHKEIFFLPWSEVYTFGMMGELLYVSTMRVEEMRPLLYQNTAPDDRDYDRAMHFFRSHAMNSSIKYDWFTVPDHRYPLLSLSGSISPKYTEQVLNTIRKYCNAWATAHGKEPARVFRYGTTIKLVVY